MPNIIEKLISYHYQRRHHLVNFFLPLILGLLIGKIFLGFPIYSVVFVSLLPLLFLIRSKPEIGILAIVILLSSIVFEGVLPQIPIGIGDLHIADSLLLALLFMIPLNLIIDKEFRIVKTRLDIPLFFFVIAVSISACIAIFCYDLDFNQTMGIVRGLTYYLLFFVVTNLIRNERQIRFLVKGLFFIGALVGIMMLVQAAIGESIQLMPGRVEKAWTLGATYEATRVLPPGQTLVYVLFITSVCLIALQKKARVKVWHYLLVFSTGVGVTLTYNRSYWATCIFSFTIFMLLTGGQARRRVIFVLSVWLLIITVFLTLFLLSNPRGRVGETIQAISARISSLFRGTELYESGSLQYRRIETEYAVKQITKHPLIGIGLGNDYRPSIFGADDKLTDYIHNGYLWILLKMGLIGFLPFLWFYFGFVVRGFKNWEKMGNNYFRSLLTGFTLSGLAVLLSNLVNPMFMQWFSIVVLSIIIGLSEGIISLNEKELLKQSE